MEWVTMGFINIPKDNILEEAQDNQCLQSVWSTSLHDSLLQLCQHVNEKHEVIAELLTEE